MGICLRTVDYSETSQVVSFLTRNTGIVNLLAKGTKRPKSKSGGAIDLLAEGEMLFSRKNPEILGLLMEFSETVSRTPLRRDARRLNVSLYMIENAPGGRPASTSVWSAAQRSGTSGPKRLTN